ncbi:phenylacetic acid degradation protein [Collibacillus ludicampi]|uniref:Phenylacetic acid degradation protein n=1 Tax=Collibacillus ludicampi TaxID=2771369 RepID=A0AAV4LJ19_9BACL|nr:1,2-phenylacetyl-CoA epoxidase subunit PaaC [Collibacillus ludicampi]GIM47768.1 phenylacetic acid degradation protein [Collibacillus ludicampi]
MTELQRVLDANQAKELEGFRDALVELLYQLADDDFILSYRGSEWLGLAPHIEEDVSFSSISQDTMGHAVAFYEMLESLGEGKADDLAQLRQPEAFRNAILVERPNGSGHYMEKPQYDWAYTVVRFYLYELFKQVRLESLVHSTYVPLAQLARKMMPELHYHLIHWSVWLKQLANSTDEAKSKMVNALQKAWVDLGDLFDLGPQADAIVQHGLIEGEELLRERWIHRVKQTLEVNRLPWFGKPVKGEYNGRAGKHTDDLVTALQTLSEVYRLDPAANW